MKISRKLFYAIGVCAILATVWVLAAPETTRDSVEDALPPGGRTIGGPGTWQGGVTRPVTVWEMFGNSVNVCVTVANQVDGTKIGVSMVSTLPIPIPLPVEDRTTQTFCAAEVTEVQISCVEVPSRVAGCEVNYRIDEVSTNPIPIP